MSTTLSSRISTFSPAQGEKTYIGSPNSAAGWSVGSGTVTVTTTTISTNLPRATVGSAMLISGGSTGDYVRFRFTADVADVSTKLKWAFAQRPISWTTSNDWKIEAFYTTDSTYATGLTQLTLSTDSSSVTNLPNANGQFRTTFDLNTALYYELRFKRAGGTGNLGVADNICGAGVVTQSAAVSGWSSYTPTLSDSGTVTLGTGGTVYGAYRRIGDSMQLRVYTTHGSTNPSGAGSALKWSLPSGLTVNSAAMVRGIIGVDEHPVAHYYDRTNSKYEAAFVECDSTTTISMYRMEPFTGAVTAANLGANGATALEITLPIAEWAGGTVNVVSNDVEFGYNTSTSDADDTASFGYGPSGSLVPGALTIARAKRVRFSTPVQATDMLFLEVKRSTETLWRPYAAHTDGSFAFVAQGTSTYGIHFQPNGSVATDVDVVFRQYAKPSTSATYGAAGDAWSSYSTTQWRLRKVSGGQSVGFSEVNPGVSSGLVSASGLKAKTAGGSVAAGYVGEVLTSGSIGGAVTVSTTSKSLGSVTVTAGNWQLYATSVYNGSTGNSYFEACINSSADSNAGTTFGLDKGLGQIISANGVGSTVSLTATVTVSSGTQAYFLNCLTSTGTAGAGGIKGVIFAVRIA